MKKQLLLFPVFLVLMTAFLTACDSTTKEAQQFAEELSTAITAGDTTTLNRIFPDAVKADSLALKYNADSLQAEALGDTLRIRFSKDVSIAAMKDADGKFRVVGSHGLFAYPDSILKLAKGTGWYDVNLDDTLNAVRMADKGFLDWLKQKAATQVVDELKEKVTISKSTVNEKEHTYPNVFYIFFDLNYKVIISNQGDCDLLGNDYAIVVEETKTICDNWSTPNMEVRKRLVRTIVKKLSGKDVPAKGTTSYEWSYTTNEEDGDYHSAHNWVEGRAIHCSINFTPNTETALTSYHPTGKEYDEYLAGKK